MTRLICFDGDASDGFPSVTTSSRIFTDTAPAIPFPR
jgi:hypothetical protein